MARAGLDAREIAAGDIVAQQVGGAPVPRDLPGAPSHDLDIELPDGRRIALEVTAATDRDIVALRAEAFGNVHPAPRLAANWWIGLPLRGNVRVKRVMSNVEAHLAVLERHGVEQIGGGSRSQRRPPPGVDEEAASAAEQVFALGVRLARRLGPPEPGEPAQLYASLSGGLSGDLDAVNGLVAACGEAKAAKLAADNADERHLFVWVDEGGAELGMATLPPPPTAPTLPGAIDVLWAATSLGASPPALYQVLWRLRPPAGWEVR